MATNPQRRAGKRGNGEGAIYQRQSDGKWCCSISLDRGKRKVIYGNTRKEVAQKLNEALRRKQHGLSFTSDRLTVATWLDHWLEHVVKTEREPTTYEGHEVMVRCHIKPFVGSIPLVKLQPEHIETWLRELQSTGRGLRTRQSALARLRTALNLAVKRSHLMRNVAELVDMPRSVRRKVSAPSSDEVRRLLDAVKGDRLEAIVTVALAVGLRRAEILGLRWQDIDLPRRTLTVRNRVNRVNRMGIIVRAGAKTEAGDERTIVLPQSIVQALEAHRTRQLETRLLAGPRWQGPSYTSTTRAARPVNPGDPHASLGGTPALTGYVFTSEIGTILDPRNLNRYFARVRKKANLPTHTFHQLRHDCASLLLAQGIPLWAVSKILGHSGIQITANIYGHLAQDLQWDAANRMDTIISSATTDVR